MHDIHFAPFDEANHLSLLMEWHKDAELSSRIGGRDWPVRMAELLKTDPLRSCFIACANEEIIGYIEFEEHPEDRLAWIGMAVDPAKRGKKWGRTILAAFLHGEFARRYREIWAGIEDDNSISKRCFASVGFIATADTPDDEGIVDYVYKYTK